jgi:hypothetical protein
MAAPASNQAKLAAMVASGMGKQQAQTVLNKAIASGKYVPAAAPVKPPMNTSGLNYQNIRDAQGTPQQQAVQDAYNKGVTPVSTLPQDMTAPELAGTTIDWTLEGDPVYGAAMTSGFSAFNAARANAMAEKQNTETQLAGQRKQLDVNATESRRRLAGNYAARGMAGGAAGALTLAEAQENARQIAAQTDIKDQISTLNANYLANYGDATAKNYDWTGTLIGQQYKTQAAQAAISAQLAKYGAI